MFVVIQPTWLPNPIKVILRLYDRLTGLLKYGKKAAFTAIHLEVFALYSTISDIFVGSAKTIALGCWPTERFFLCKFVHH